MQIEYGRHTTVRKQQGKQINLIQSKARQTTQNERDPGRPATRSRVLTDSAAGALSEEPG